MTHLEALPEELIARIIGCIGHDRRALAGLCRCSKKLCRIGRATLYHTITIVTTSPTTYTLPLLLRTLLGERSHALLIRNLTLWTPAQATTEEGIIITSRFLYAEDVFDGVRVVAAAIDAINSSRVYDGSRTLWTINLGALVQTAYAGLLLLLATNLQRLECRVVSSYGEIRPEHDLLGKLFFLPQNGTDNDISSIVSSLNFNNIKQLSLTGTQVDFLAFRFPELRELEVDFVVGGPDLGNTGWGWSCSTIFPGLPPHYTVPPVGHLHKLLLRTDWEDLQSPFLTNTCTARLMSYLRCAIIEEVDFRVDHSPRLEMHHLLGSWEWIIRDLFPVQTKIKSLTLGVSDNPEYFDLACLRRFEPITTLRHFTALRDLCLPQQALIHRDYGKMAYQKPDLGRIFPPSLQKVTIEWPDRKIVDWMAELVTTKLVGGHDITSLTFICDNVFGVAATWLKRQEQMLSEAGKAGIVVDIIDMENGGPVTEIGGEEDDDPTSMIRGLFG